MEFLIKIYSILKVTQIKTLIKDFFENFAAKNYTQKEFLCNAKHYCFFYYCLGYYCLGYFMLYLGLF